jgi:hypothetical protein
MRRGLRDEGAMHFDSFTETEMLEKPLSKPNIAAEDAPNGS